MVVSFNVYDYSSRKFLGQPERTFNDSEHLPNKGSVFEFGQKMYNVVAVEYMIVEDGLMGQLEVAPVEAA